MYFSIVPLTIIVLLELTSSQSNLTEPDRCMKQCTKICSQSTCQPGEKWLSEDCMIEIRCTKRRKLRTKKFSCASGEKCQSSGEKGKCVEDVKDIDVKDETALDMFTKKINFNCPLNDIAQYEVHPNECAKKCLAVIDCVAFITNTFNGCWLKSNCSNPIPTENTSVYLWKKVSTIGPFGGDSGNPYSDRDMIVHGDIIGFTLRTDGHIILCFGFIRQNTQKYCFGGHKGGEVNINFIEGEYVIAFKGRAGGNIDQMTIITNKASYGPYGGTGGNEYSAYLTGRLVYITGVAGDLRLASITFHYICNVCTIGPFGGVNGEQYSDRDMIVHGEIIGFTLRIDGKGILCFGFIRPNTQKYCFGGYKGTEINVYFIEGEYIIAFKGLAGAFIDQMTIITNKASYGPYGGTGGNEYSAYLTGRLVYITGLADNLRFDAISFHYICNECTIGPFGGDSGEPYSDREMIVHGDIIGFTLITDGHIILCFGFIRPNTQKYCFGGRKGGEVNIYFIEGEYIIAFTGRAGGNIDQITIITNKASYGPYGGTGGNAYSAYLTGRMVYITGVAGDLRLASITFHYIC